MADPIGLVIPMMREMREVSAELHEQARAPISGLEKRVRAVEETLRELEN